MRQQLFLSFMILVFLVNCQAQVSEEWIPIRVPGVVYPILARSSRLQGDVRAKCSISEDGSVASVEILASPHSLLSDYVKDNLAKWKFRSTKPNLQNGQVIVKYTFLLRGACEEVRMCHETEFLYEFPYHVIAIADHYPLRS
jgi:TonB family protein